MPGTRVAFALSTALVVITLAMVARPTRGAELIPGKTTDRKFPQGVFCPFPFDVSFTADGSDITLRISTSTVNYLYDPQTFETHWSHQQLDNICVVPESEYAAHHGPLGSYSGDCYFPHPDNQLTETFYFQDAGAIPLEELFPSTGDDPANRGWDLTHGCSWNANATAPNDPGTDASFAPSGCLDLGQFDAALSLSDSAYTTRTVTGLTAGQQYRLTGWWNVDDMQEGKIFMTVQIFGSNNPTPIVRRTWGAHKSRYRE
jgi:hypothetical protein